MIGEASTRSVQMAQDLSVHVTFDAESKLMLGDRESLLSFVIGLRFGLLVDIDPRDAGAAEVFRRGMLSHVIHAQSYFLFFKSLSDLYYENVQSLEDLPAALVAQLSFQRRGVGKATWNTLLSTLRHLLSRLDVLKSNDLTRLSTWINFDLKLTIPRQDLIDLALQDYVEQEIREHEWSYPDLSEYAQIIARWFCDYSHGSVIPKNGPGATFEAGRNAGIETKYNVMRFPRDLLDRIEVSRIPPPPSPTIVGAEEARCSRLICVPKTALKVRTISAEPAALQWYQQGVRRAITECFGSKLGQCRLRLDRQDISRTHALRGSIAGEFDTLDLSNASDSVTVQLVSELFRGVPQLLIDLFVSRSTHTELENGTVVELAKFAPMGSAVCFPVESIIFSSICEASVHSCLGRSSCSEDYTVYGDDIVIRECLFDDVVCRLESLHFTINRRKTFSGTFISPFREACGIEACMGFDVTPLRLSRGLQPLCTETMSSADRLMGWTDLANRAYQSDLPIVRAVVLSQLHSVLGERFYEIRRIASQPACVLPAILSNDEWATNYRSPHRYNQDLQISEFRTLMATVPVSDSIGNQYCLYDWLLTTLWKEMHPPSTVWWPEKDDASTPDPWEKARNLVLSRRWHS